MSGKTSGKDELHFMFSPQSRNRPRGQITPPRLTPADISFHALSVGIGGENGLGMHMLPSIETWPASTILGTEFISRATCCEVISSVCMATCTLSRAVFGYAAAGTRSWAK